MSALALSDLHQIDAEPRIHDLRLGEALGFSRPRAIRQIVTRNLSELERYGTSPRRVAMIETGKTAKRRVEEYHLNEGQALLICMFANTPNAADVRQQVIEVYMAWRKNRAAPSPRRLPAANTVIGRFGLDPDLQAVSAAIAPHWSNGRRSPFWRDLEVRRLLIETHREMEIEQCRALCIERFGPARTPSSSALCRFWIVLDRVSGKRKRP